MSRLPRGSSDLNGQTLTAGPGDYTLRSELEKKSFNLKYNKFAMKGNS